MWVNIRERKEKENVFLNFICDKTTTTNFVIAWTRKKWNKNISYGEYKNIQSWKLKKDHVNNVNAVSEIQISQCSV